MRKPVIITLIIFLAIFLIYNYYPGRALPANATIDSIVVRKSERRMDVYSHRILLKSYNIALGGNPIGHKQFEGDEKTPEGHYIVSDKNANSDFHKNLGISYPNGQDMENAKKLGKPPGGDIKIHGLKNGLGFLGRVHRLTNWTNGCIALTNSEIEELFQSTPKGTPIEILP